MSITYIGLIVIFVSLLIFVVAPRYLVPWAIGLSVLQAASVFNVGGAFPIGVSPYFFVTILICLRFLPLWLSGQLGFAPRRVRVSLCAPSVVNGFMGRVIRGCFSRALFRRSCRFSPQRYGRGLGNPVAMDVE